MDEIISIQRSLKSKGYNTSEEEVGVDLYCDVAQCPLCCILYLHQLVVEIHLELCIQASFYEKSRRNCCKVSERICFEAAQS